MRLPCVALLAVVLSGCDTTNAIAPPPGHVETDGVRIEVAASEVEQGDVLGLTLVNESDRTVETGVFGCALVERWSGSTWERLEEDNDRACILPLYTVPPGQTYEGAFSFDVAPGTVRLVHSFHVQGVEGTETLASPPIEVVR